MLNSAGTDDDVDDATTGEKLSALGDFSRGLFAFLLYREDTELFGLVETKMRGLQITYSAVHYVCE